MYDTIPVTVSLTGLSALQAGAVFHNSYNDCMLHIAEVPHIVRCLHQ